MDGYVADNKWLEKRNNTVKPDVFFQLGDVPLALKVLWKLYKYKKFSMFDTCK